MQRRVTQQDIATELGLDKSTVSLALRNHPEIAVATQKKVKAAAAKLGYRPDPALATLARQRWAGHETGSGATLAYLVDSQMENFRWQRRFLDSARRRATERGYLLNEFNLSEYATMKSASRVLHNRGIRGLLVPQFAHTAGPSIFELPAGNFTVVCLDIGWVSVPFHMVASDIFETTRQVWREVIKRGYRRIGGAILSHTPRAMDDATRFGASVASQEDWLKPEEWIPLLRSDHMDRDAFLAWMDEHRPEVVIGFISRVYDWLCEAGWKVPGDVAFAALVVVSDERPQVSGAVRLKDTIGEVGVDALIAAMNENEWGVPAVQRKLLIEPHWHEGSTLPPRSG